MAVREAFSALMIGKVVAHISRLNKQIYNSRKRNITITIFAPTNKSQNTNDKKVKWIYAKHTSASVNENNMISKSGLKFFDAFGESLFDCSPFISC
jgi:hypothetical protein